MKALIITLSVILFVCLIGVIVLTSGNNTKIQTTETTATVVNRGQAAPVTTPQRTTDGYIIYDVLPVSMKADEIRTFKVPIGTRVDRYQTSPDKTDIEELDTKNGKYEVRAKKDVTFELVWRIEKGFENKVKPK